MCPLLRLEPVPVTSKALIIKLCPLFAVLRPVQPDCRLAARAGGPARQHTHAGLIRGAGRGPAPPRCSRQAGQNDRPLPALSC